MHFARLLTLAGLVVTSVLSAPLIRVPAEAYDLTSRDQYSGKLEDLSTRGWDVNNEIDTRTWDEEEDLVARNVLKIGSEAFLTLSRRIATGLRTQPSKAVFWSGTTKGGQSVIHDAEAYARARGKFTLEMLLKQQGLELPQFPFKAGEEEAASELWKLASGQFAKHASGEVDVVLGDIVRSQSIWNSVEKPSLEKSEAVTKIMEYANGKDPVRIK
ncbi:hypothetical protein NMY22_g3509 [Coprinellus aureogranulatus]|nr:hypothetical protein NMY22_g3509 [Coprinellus aureogranulatus]